MKKGILFLLVIVSCQLAVAQFSYDTFYVSNPKPYFYAGDTVRFLFRSYDAPSNANTFKYFIHNSLGGIDAQNYVFNTTTKQIQNPAPNYFGFYFVVNDTMRNTIYYVNTYQGNGTYDNANNKISPTFKVAGNVILPKAFTYDSFVITNPKNQYYGKDTVRFQFHSKNAMDFMKFQIQIAYYQIVRIDTSIGKISNPSPQNYSFYFIIPDTLNDGQYWVFTKQGYQAQDDSNAAYIPKFNKATKPVTTGIIDQDQQDNTPGLYEFYDLNGSFVAKYWGNNPAELNLIGPHVYKFTGQNGRIRRGKLLFGL